MIQGLGSRVSVFRFSGLGFGVLGFRLEGFMV
jgi:hypothetical protein